MQLRSAILIFVASLISLPALLAQSDCSQVTPITAETKAAAEHGEAKAQVVLADAYELGCGVPQDEKQAFSWAQKAAEQGDAAGQLRLAMRYRTGFGAPKDPASAVMWYRLAARQGYASALYNLGTCYFNGEGVPINDELAYAWMMAAGDAGFPNVPELASHIELKPDAIAEAQANLGAMYELGIDLPQNFANSVKWYRVAAQANNPAAQTSLANLLFKGHGTVRNDEEAFHLCEKAASRHFAPALYCIAYAQEHGFGTNQDLSAALKGYNKAAEAGHAPAMHELGSLHSQGRMVKADPAAAYMWFLLAASYGLADPKQMEELSAHLSKEQLESAQKKAGTWINKYRPPGLYIKSP